ncbi:hypothetical protein Q7C36_020965 [Tachysurus vachellii]|uniref:Uncharacterized protein n=1 Tax=Tachysurus vachellii TaxID=175792 RepID=A0AA88J415_TACVA|nr:hypothetical protein Q7C36_020965 [Tachysurus vachellii]
MSYVGSHEDSAHRGIGASFHRSKSRHRGKKQKAQKTSTHERMAGRLCFAVIKWHLLSFCCQTSLALGYRRENPQFGTKKPLMLQH